MSLSKNKVTEPGEKVFKFRAILPVKNAPIHINPERENQLLNASVEPKVIVETLPVLGDNNISSFQVEFKNDSYPTTQYLKPDKSKNKYTGLINKGTQTEGVIRFVGSPRSGRYAQSTSGGRSSLTNGRAANLAQQIQNIIDLQPEASRKLLQEKREMALKRKIEEVVKACDDKESADAKRARGNMSSLQIMKHRRASQVQDRIKSILTVMEKCYENMNQPVKVVVRDDNGRLSNLHATLVNIDDDQNMILTGVTQVWKRRNMTLSASARNAIPVGTKRVVYDSGITEKHLGNAIWLCQKQIPKLFLRGKNVIEIFPKV